MLMTRKPRFVVDRMVLSGSRLNTMAIKRPNSHQLKLTGEGFLEKAAQLWNEIPVELRKENDRERLNSRVKK